MARVIQVVAEKRLHGRVFPPEGAELSLEISWNVGSNRFRVSLEPRVFQNSGNLGAFKFCVSDVWRPNW